MASGALRLRTGIGEMETAEIAGLPLRQHDVVNGVLVVGLLAPLGDDTRGFLENAARQLAVALDQVLLNLLTNALKFTPQGGGVRLEVSSATSDVEVAISDTGPGIAPEEMPVLFGKFGQTSSAKRVHAKGAGLGLLICRHLVEARGGRIWAESEVGRGARFAFRLPREPRRAPDAPRRANTRAV